MGKRLSGRDVDVMIGDYAVHFDSISLSIDDSSEVAMDRGRPNGYTQGEVKASGDVTLDVANFSVLSNAAKGAGSWQALAPFDIVFNGKTREDELRVEAFGCLLKITDLLDANGNGEGKLTHTLSYDVTGKDFITINGVPYLSTDDIAGLL